MQLTYLVKENNTYKTVREVIKTEFSISSRLLTSLRKEKKIYLNGNITYVDKELSEGDLIIVDLNFEEDNSNVVPYNFRLNILYEDDAYIVIDKPAGIAIHPSCMHYNNSLSNAVKFYFDSIGLKVKIRPVNRLDKDTSGLVIFAKNQYIQECLVKQMTSSTFKKTYLAILTGTLEKQSGTINAPIARKNNSIIERCIDPNGDIAITNFKVLKYFNEFTFVEFILKTGRTHQIRVHSQFIGHSILGDTLYGKASPLINRQALHAHKIEFIHPLTHKNVNYMSELPDDMRNILI